MKIDVSFRQSFWWITTRDKNIVVIDVLRASTTTIAALAQGAREIIPVANIESAVKISGSLFGEVTLRGGERSGKMIEGFNLGKFTAWIYGSDSKGKVYYLLYDKRIGSDVKKPLCPEFAYRWVCQYVCGRTKPSKNSITIFSFFAPDTPVRAVILVLKMLCVLEWS